MHPSKWSRMTPVLYLNGSQSQKMLFGSSRLCGERKNLETEQPDPHHIECDYVGPPDAESNLRVFVHRIPPEETKLARNYRLKLLEVEAWNQAFWREHNRRFYKEKDEFIQQHRLSLEKCDRGKEKEEEPTASSTTSGLSDDEMSVFYKRFLDQNHQMHVKYNLTWYRKNLELLIMSFRAELERFIMKIQRERKRKAN